MEYDPIFQPGFHNLEEANLDIHFVRPFPNSNQRELLLYHFRRYLSAIRTIGVSIEIWIDGSFATKKFEPSDIDIALVFEPNEVNSLPQDKIALFMEIFNSAEVKIRYKCDIYPVSRDNQMMLSYWRGWFGFDRDERPKGIPRIFL
jgi:predicted nucleotidyltransferase